MLRFISMHSGLHNRLKNNAVSRAILLCTQHHCCSAVLVEQNNSFIFATNLTFCSNFSSSSFFWRPYLYANIRNNKKNNKNNKKKRQLFYAAIYSFLFQCWIGRISHLTEKKQKKNKKKKNKYPSLTHALSVFLFLRLHTFAARIRNSFCFKSSKLFISLLEIKRRKCCSFIFQDFAKINVQFWGLLCGLHKKNKKKKPEKTGKKTKTICPNDYQQTNGGREMIIKTEEQLNANGSWWMKEGRRENIPRTSL